MVIDTAGQDTSVVTYAWPDEFVSPTLQVAVSDGDLQSTTSYGYGEDMEGLLVSSETCVDDEDAVLAGIDLEYDTDGNVTEEVVDLGGGDELTTVTTYIANSEQPNEITVSDDNAGDGHESYIDNDYDANLNLTSVEEELVEGGATAHTDYTYDANGRMTSEKGLISGTPESGTWAETTYSSFATNGEPETIVHKDVVRSYGGSGSDLTETADYDAFGNLLEKTDTAGETTETNTYDLAGRLETSEDASGVVTHYTYDVMGNVIETWRTVSGSSVKADWSKHYQGTASSPTDYGFDAVGRETKRWTYLHDGSTATLQATTTTTYDGLGNSITASDSTVGGQDEKWTYDEYGNETAHWEMGVSAYDANRGYHTGYDELGQPVSETEPGNSADTEYEYDQSGNVTTQTNPDGSLVISTYDDEGNQLTESNTLEGYDPSTNPSAVATTTNSYNDGDLLTSQTSPGNLTTNYSYDLLGRQTAAGDSSTVYNSMGWVLREEDGDGIAVERSYDTAGRIDTELVTDDTNDGRLTDYDYNDLGQVTDQVEKDAGPDPDTTLSTLHYDYDGFGRTTKEKHTVGGTVVEETDFTIDSLGRITDSDETQAAGVETEIDYPENAADGTETTIAYDGGATPDTELTIATNAREQESARAAAIANLGTITRTVTARDAAERWATATLTGSLSFSRTFDATDGQLTGQSGDGFSSAGSYDYDPDSGRKSEETLPLAYGGTIDTDYAYDATGRLESSDLGGLTATTFDSAGNLTAFTDSGGTASLTYNSDNQLTEMSYGGVTTELAYDATNGWRTEHGPSADPDEETFDYLPTGRLVSYDNVDTGISATYAYDAAGQRIESVVDDGAVETTTDYTYDGLLLLSLEAATDEPDSWRIDYLYDEEGRPYAGTYRSPASSTSPTLFVIITTDRGDVVELLDEDGDAFAAYRYDEWGNPTSSSTQSTTNITSQVAADIAERQVLRYAGYAYDAESGLYYCSARHYDPVTRQFISKDPANADREESAYQYCGGEPVTGTDPSGYRVIRRRVPFRMTRGGSVWRRRSKRWIMALEIGYVSAGRHYWRVKRVKWDNAGTDDLPSFSRSSRALAKLYERRRRSWGTAWIVRDYKPWRGRHAIHIGPADVAYQTWVWNTKGRRTRKWYRNHGWRSPATMVRVYQELHATSRVGRWRGYFSYSVKLPTR